MRKISVRMETFQFLIDRYFERVLYLLGTLNHIKKVFKDEAARLEKYGEKHPDLPFITGTHLVISDLTGDTDKGWELNYSTGKSRSIGYEEYESEMTALLNRESAFMISQCYEALETFLKDLIALHLFQRSRQGENYHSKFDGCSSYAEFKTTIRTIRSTNNKDLFKLLKKSCPEYKAAEESNNLGFNLYSWYQAYSVVRHSVTHQSSIIKKEQLAKLQPLEKALLEKYFPGSIVNDSYHIDISFGQATKTLKRITEFGFLLFKCVSICNGEDWQILKT